MTITTYNYWTEADSKKLLRMLEKGELEYTAAIAIGRTTTAVKKHLVRLRRDHNVPTTTALVAKCIREGRI